MWSLGVVTFFLLSGVPPFIANTSECLQKKILTTDYDFNGNVWKNVSKEARHFIQALLEPNLD